MRDWLRRFRGSIGLGLTWAVGWAIAGILIGASSLVLTFLPWDDFFRWFDAPLPALAIPGFFAGLFFSTVLGIAGRNRRFDELSLPVFTGWGALGGAIFGAIAAAIAFPLGTIVFLGALSAASAAATLVVARKAERQQLADVKESERLLQFKE